MMKKTPLALSSLLVLLAAGAAGYVGYERKMVVAAPQVAEAPKPAPVAKPAETQVAAAATQQAKPVEPPKPILPTFDTVRVSPEGDAVIAGRAAPNSEVVAKLNGVVIATALSNALGEFAIVPKDPLPAGAGALTLETKVGGVMQASNETVAISVKAKAAVETTVAVLTPNEPTKIVQSSQPKADGVTLDAIDYDTTGSIMFSGRGSPDATVRLYVDNSPAGEIKSGSDGKWMFKGTNTVPVGTHTLRADAVAADGSVTSRVELPFLREEPAKVAALEAAPAPAAPVAAAAPTETKVVEATPAPVVAPAPRRITIQPGNNLWRLSREIYGFGREYTVIYEANKDQIKNPRLIYPGQILTAPVKATN